MSFPGQPPRAPQAPAPLRTYQIVVDGQGADTVKAHYLTRDPGHVCFWQDGEDGKQDILVLAINNSLMDEMKEVTAA